MEARKKSIMQTRIDFLRQGFQQVETIKLRWKEERLRLEHPGFDRPHALEIDLKPPPNIEEQLLLTEQDVARADLVDYQTRPGPVKFDSARFGFGCPVQTTIWTEIARETLSQVAAQLTGEPTTTWALTQDLKKLHLYQKVPLAIESLLGEGQRSRIKLGLDDEGVELTGYFLPYQE